MRKGSIKTEVIEYRKQIGEYLTVKETADLFKVNPLTIRRQIQSGKLKAFKVGWQIKITPEALAEYIKENHVRVIRNETSY